MSDIFADFEELETNIDEKVSTHKQIPIQSKQINNVLVSDKGKAVRKFADERSIIPDVILMVRNKKPLEILWEEYYCRSITDNKCTKAFLKKRSSIKCFKNIIHSNQKIQSQSSLFKNWYVSSNVSKVKEMKQAISKRDLSSRMILSNLLNGIRVS